MTNVNTIISCLARARPDNPWPPLLKIEWELAVAEVADLLEKANLMDACDFRRKCYWKSYELKGRRG